MSDVSLLLQNARKLACGINGTNNQSHWFIGRFIKTMHNLLASNV